MNYEIRLTTGEVIGSVMASGRMTDEEIIDCAGIKLMQTEEDYVTGNGYDIEELEIVSVTE